jgi:hypothetical protein
VGQEKETDETRHKTPVTQQDQQDGKESEVEEKTTEEESVEAEVWFAVDIPAPTDTEGSTDAQPTRPKGPKN